MRGDEPWARAIGVIVRKPRIGGYLQSQCMPYPVHHSFENHYETLEVSPSASLRVIQAAYRCLLQIHHPDKNAGSLAASERAAYINKAYAVLSDAAQRRAYDNRVGAHRQTQERRSPLANAAGASGALSSGPGVSRPYGFRPLL